MMSCAVWYLQVLVAHALNDINITSAAVEADVVHHGLAVGPVLVLDHQLDDAVGLVLHPRRALGVAREGKTADFGEVARDDVVGRPDAAGEDVAVGERADELLVLPGEENCLLALLDKPTPSMVCQWLVPSSWFLVPSR